MFELFLVTLIPNVGSLTNSTLYFLLVAGDGRFILSASSGISKAEELTGRNCGYQISHMIFYHISIENSITYYINVFCIVLYLLINAINFFLQSFATYVCIPVTYRMINSRLFLQRSWGHCPRIHPRKRPLLCRQAYHRSSWDLSSLSAPRTGSRDRPGRFPEVNIQQISLTRTLGLFHENVGSICTFTLLREKML